MSLLRQGRTLQSWARSCGGSEMCDSTRRMRLCCRDAAFATSAITPTAADTVQDDIETANAAWTPDPRTLGAEAADLERRRLNGIDMGGVVCPATSFDQKHIFVPSTMISSPKDDGRHDGTVETIVRHYFGEQRSRGNNGGGNDAELDHLRRANVQLPPGYGKTSLALKTIAQMAHDGVNSDGSPPRLVLYVTPTLLLVDQVFEHLEKFEPLQGIDYSSMIIASKTKSALPNTTSPERIASFLSPSSSHENVGSSLRLLVSTYHSLPRVGEAISLLGQDTGAQREIDFGIFDEAHSMEGSGKLFGYGLCDESLPIRHRLFLTATPFNYVERADDRRRANVFEDEKGTGSTNKLPRKSRRRSNVRSILDTDLFGPTIVRRTQPESVERGITVPLTLCAIDRTEAKSILGHALNESAPREELLPYFVKAAIEKLGVKKTVVFHSRNDRAKAFAVSARDVLGGDIGAFHVNGTMSPRERDAVLSEFKAAPRAIVTNCMLLSTGVDIAELDMCVIADPVRSQVATRQRLGRVTRLAKGKKRGYIFVPLLFDAGETYDASALLQEDGFTTLVAAFSAMVEGNPELQRGVDFVVKERSNLEGTFTGTITLRN